MQRPWTIKAILSSLQPPARLLEIGSGEPLAASLLASLGYTVWACDPFDGSGRALPNMKPSPPIPTCTSFRSYFDGQIAADFKTQPLDVIFSISVLEHVKPESTLAGVFAATAAALRPGGYSIHCADVVIQGKRDAWHIDQVKRIVHHQSHIAAGLPVVARIDPAGDKQRRRRNDHHTRADLETFYLSPKATTCGAEPSPMTTSPSARSFPSNRLLNAADDPPRRTVSESPPIHALPPHSTSYKIP